MASKAAHRDERGRLPRSSMVAMAIVFFGNYQPDEAATPVTVSTEELFGEASPGIVQSMLAHFEQVVAWLGVAVTIENSPGEVVPTGTSRVAPLRRRTTRDGLDVLLLGAQRGTKTLV
jgi:hypothetical protein